MPKRLPSECDYWCNFRSCLHKGWDRGPYVQGQGYSSYHKKPIYVCMHRFLEGCPDGPLNFRCEPDWDQMRKFVLEAKPKQVRELASHLIDLCVDLLKKKEERREKNK